MGSFTTPLPSLGFVKDVGGAVRAVVGIRDCATVGVGLPGHPIGVVVVEGRRLALFIFRISSLSLAIVIDCIED